MKNEIINIYDDTKNPNEKCELIKMEWNKYCNYYKKKINLDDNNIILLKSNYECTRLITSYYSCYIKHIRSNE
jgi:hypothetical protein